MRLSVPTLSSSSPYWGGVAQGQNIAESGINNALKQRMQQLANQSQEQKNQVQPDSLQAALQKQRLDNQFQQQSNVTHPDQLKSNLTTSLLANQMSRNKMKEQPGLLHSQALQEAYKAEHMGAPKASDYQLVSSGSQQYLVNKTDPTDIKPLNDPTTGRPISSKPGLAQQLSQMLSVDNQGNVSLAQPQDDGGQNAQDAPSDTGGGAGYSNGQLLGPVKLGGTGRGTAGATLVDPASGGAASVPATAQVSAAQKSLLAEKSAQSQFNNIYSGLSGYVGTKGFANRLVGVQGRLAGKETPKYDAYKSATETQLPLLVETLNSGLAFPMTDKSVALVKNAVSPKWDDTKFSVAHRLADVQATLQLRSKIYKDFLRKGIALPAQAKEMAEKADIPPSDVKESAAQNYGMMISGIDHPVRAPSEGESMKEFRDSLTPKERNAYGYYLRYLGK